VERTRGARALELQALQRDALGVEIPLELVQRGARRVVQVLLGARVVLSRTGADGSDDQRRSREACGSQREGDGSEIGGLRVVADDDRLGHLVLLSEVTPRA
jgi:hypothetical protein